MLVEVERVAWEVFLLLTGVTTVRSTGLGDTELVVVRTDDELVAAVVMEGEDDVRPVEEEVGDACAVWYLAARILSLVLLLSLFCFLGRFWYW